jgi:tetratricopeptide (TPR) repeat protein
VEEDLAGADVIREPERVTEWIDWGIAAPGLFIAALALSARTRSQRVGCEVPTDRVIPPNPAARHIQGPCFGVLTMRARVVVAILVLAVPSAAAVAQSVQYRSPGGIEYRSAIDTGAVAAAESALAVSPRDVEAIIALGLAQSSVMQYREAIATFTRGIEIAPNNAVLHRWRGHRYLSVREMDRARADLQRGLSIDSTCYGCLYHLGIVRYVTGDFAGAAELFARALPMAPEPGEFAGSVDWLWSSLTRAGKLSEAQAVLDRLADSVTAENAYARRILLYRGIIGADQVMTPADTAGVQVATLSYGIGNWYLIQGDTAQARAWFERSVGTPGWPAFGFIASEAELRRLR